ncbi:MAG: hypothetical protein ACREOU_13045 [Candidatus Eiseniibacteriota bacterium]
MPRSRPSVVALVAWVVALTACVPAFPAWAQAPPTDVPPRTPPPSTQSPDAPPPTGAQVSEQPPSGWRPRPVRSGTVSLGGYLQYGTLFGSTRFAETFDNGLGGGFTLRYRSSSDQAFGLSFESHSFDASSPGDSAAAPEHLQLITTTIEYYKFFNTRKRMPRYLVIGAGFMQSRQTDRDGEKEFPGDGGTIKLGGGTEYWFNRTLTLDLAVRYYGILSQSEWTHDVQLALGINFYTSP